MSSPKQESKGHSPPSSPPTPAKKITIGTPSKKPPAKAPAGTVSSGTGSAPTPGPAPAAASSGSASAASTSGSTVVVTPPGSTSGSTVVVTPPTKPTGSLQDEADKLTQEFTKFLLSKNFDSFVDVKALGKYFFDVLNDQPLIDAQPMAQIVTAVNGTVQDVTGAYAVQLKIAQLKTAWKNMKDDGKISQDATGFQTKVTALDQKHDARIAQRDACKTAEDWQALFADTRLAFPSVEFNFPTLTTADEALIRQLHQVRQVFIGPDSRATLTDRMHIAQKLNQELRTKQFQTIAPKQLTSADGKTPKKIEAFFVDGANLANGQEDATAAEVLKTYNELLRGFFHTYIDAFCV